MLTGSYHTDLRTEISAGYLIGAFLQILVPEMMAELLCIRCIIHNIILLYLVIFIIHIFPISVSILQR